MNGFRRRAFTLLELLTVVGIIGILVTLLAVGGIKIIGSGKVNATRVTLNVLQNMLSEFDAKTRLSPAPAYWLWSENGTTPLYEISPASAAAGLDLNFWRVPFKAIGPPVQYDSLCAPGLVDGNEETSTKLNAERNASFGVYNTTLAMSLLLNLPSNRTALEKLSANQLFTPKWMNTAGSQGQILMPGVDRVLMTSDDTTAQSPSYYQGAIVEYQGPSETKPRRYRAVADPGGATPNPTSTTPWRELPNASPMLLDAWNNPIILVPGSGLRVRLLNGEKAYIKPDGSPYNTANLGVTVVISPEGQIDKTTPTAPFCKKPGRPFFASAGPDGSFVTGDDNLYSFEQQ